MMRFIKYDSALLYAICDFCEEQHKKNGDPHFPIYHIISMLSAAYDDLDKIGGVLPVTEIHRYHISCNNAEDILPERMESNGVIYKNAVHLGTFIPVYFDEDDYPDHNIRCGYDVIYDIDDNKVKLLYRAEISNDIITTLYRVEDDNYNFFDAADFLVSLMIQLAEKLRDGREYLGKVCDFPCA